MEGLVQQDAQALHAGGAPYQQGIAPAAAAPTPLMPLLPPSAQQVLHQEHVGHHLAQHHAAMAAASQHAGHFTIASPGQMRLSTSEGRQQVLYNHSGAQAMPMQPSQQTPEAVRATGLLGNVSARQGKQGVKAIGKGKGRSKGGAGKERDEGPEQWDPRRPGAQKTVQLSQWLQRESQEQVDRLLYIGCSQCLKIEHKMTYGTVCYNTGQQQILTRSDCISWVNRTLTCW